MKRTERIRYEIDPHNRLVYEKTGKHSEVPLFRAVLDGKFEIDERNQVTYHVKKPLGTPIPQQVKLRGTWSLDNDHRLVLTLDKWGNQIAGNKITLASELIDVNDNRVSFALISRDSEGNNHLYMVTLGGSWQADAHNRLSFNIAKEKGSPDRLILQGAWEVNKQNEIYYSYAKQVRGKKEKTAKSITLKGYWDISEKYKLTYVVNKEMKTGVSFKVSVGKSNARGLQYEIGIGAMPSKKTVTLLGEWRVTRDRGVLFEMPCGEGEKQKVILGAWCKLKKNLNLEMRLQNGDGEDLGVTVTLSRQIVKGQGEAFIRALRSQKEMAIAVGAGVRW